MKLILSRKGFDSSAGGVPSPILPDGRMVSLPIPDKLTGIPYADIKLADGESIASPVSQLTKGRIPSHYRAHLDPDLNPDSLPRLPGWRPIFGQTGAAQGHLRKNEVGKGSLFLFFGLFRHVEYNEGKYVWQKETKPCHIIWGWLQVGEILELGMSKPKGYDWAEYHPHFNRHGDSNNVIYVASPYLNPDGTHSNKTKGAGLFPRFSPELQLTDPSSSSPTVWRLPPWFYPKDKKTSLSYHSDLKRWRMRGSYCELKSAARGQEFILDCNEYPEAIPWVHELLEIFEAIT